jgi:hypothetical protein
MLVTTYSGACRCYAALDVHGKAWEEDVLSPETLLRDIDLHVEGAEFGPYPRLWAVLTDHTSGLFRCLARVAQSDMVAMGLVRYPLESGEVHFFPQRPTVKVVIIPLLMAILYSQKRFSGNIVGLVQEANGTWRGLTWKGVVRYIGGSRTAGARGWWEECVVVVSRLRGREVRMHHMAYASLVLRVHQSWLASDVVHHIYVCVPWALPWCSPPNGM